MSEIIHAFQVSIGEEIPTEIQWMPPGRHTVVASKNGKRHEATVVVDEPTVSRLNAALARLRAENKAKPYLDFNHEDREASAHVEAFSWGGDHPESGGIRARVKWTKSGITALEGRAYQSFSPSFLLDAQGRVSNLVMNMGGLVNRPAFRSITPIVTKEEETMSDNTEQLRQITELQTKVAELTAKVATAEQTINAKSTEITGLQAKLRDSQKIAAKAIVDQAVVSGKIPASNTALQAKWVEQIADDLSRAELLDAMEARVPAAHITRPVSGGASTASAGGNEPEILVKARQIVEKQGLALCDAVGVVAAKEPALYESYLASMRGQ